MSRLCLERTGVAGRNQARHEGTLPKDATPWLTSDERGVHQQIMQKILVALIGATALVGVAHIAFPSTVVSTAKARFGFTAAGKYECLTDVCTCLKCPAGFTCKC